MLKALPEVSDAAHVHTCAPHSIDTNSTGSVIVTTLSATVKIFTHQRTSLDGLKLGRLSFPFPV